MKKIEKSIILLSLVFTVSLVFIGCSKDDDSNSETSGNVIKNFNQENMNFTEKLVNRHSLSLRILHGR